MKPNKIFFSTGKSMLKHAGKIKDKSFGPGSKEELRSIMVTDIDGNNAIRLDEFFFWPRIQVYINAKDLIISEQQKEITQLTKACEGFKEAMMENQDKACLGHIEEVVVLKALLKEAEQNEDALKKENQKLKSNI